MAEFDLWCNLKYLSLEKLLQQQPEGWLAVLPYHHEAKQIQVYWEGNKYWLQLDARQVKETDYYTALKVLKSLKRAADEYAQSFAQEINDLEEYHDDYT